MKSGIRQNSITLQGVSKACAVLLLLLLLPTLASGQSWTWTAETVDTSGKSPSLAVDEQGNVHLSYLSDLSSLKYAFRAADNSRWFTMTIDGVGGGWDTMPTKLALDRQGNAHICYTPGAIKYAFFDGKKWNTQQISPKSGTVAYNCAVAIAADGTAHITWYQYGKPDGSDYLHIKYAFLQDGAWIARTIDFSAQTGKWHSLALDAQGHPHISYDAFVNGQLKYAYWDGQHWVVKVVDSRDTRRFKDENTDAVGMGSALLLDSQGRAYISYEDDNSLKYARQGDTSWKIDTVDKITPSGSWVGYRSRQVLDRRGFPHVSYEDAGSVKHAYWDGKQWHIQVISPLGVDRNRYPDIAIDRDGTLYISYRDAFDGSLKVAVGRPAGTAAQTTAAENTKEKH
jgi:hypothetical protein